MRASKEDTESYKTGFSLMFKTCPTDFSKFGSLKGIIVDWSDTQTKRLRQAVGDDVADRLLRSCNVHRTRSYQYHCVEERINSSVQKCNGQLKHSVLLQSW